MKQDRHTRQFDMFIPLIGDLSLKDQRETMERPFCSLQKRKRLKPIEYMSADGKTWVKVMGAPDFGIATIWDYDVIIWAASQLGRMKSQGVNDLPRTLSTTSFDLLKSIKRDVGGSGYKELHASLQRLQATTIQTSIRASKRKGEAQFSWIDSFDLETNPETGAPRGLKITLSDWVFSGIVEDKALLTMHQDYFLLSGGIERAVYRIARKHAGSQPQGFTCSVPLLQDKTGSDCNPYEFTRKIKQIVARNELPEYFLSHKRLVDGTPAIHFIRRDLQSRDAVSDESAPPTPKQIDALRKRAVRALTQGTG